MQTLKMLIHNASQKMRRWVHRRKFVCLIRPTDFFLVTYQLSLEDFEQDKFKWEWSKVEHD